MKLSRLQLIELERRKLLLLKPEFIDDVTNFRKNHHIPTGGFQGGMALEEYWTYMNGLSEKWFDSVRVEVNKEIKSLNKAGKEAEARRLARQTNAESPISKMYAKVSELSKEYAIFDTTRDKGFDEFLLSGYESVFLTKISPAGIEILPSGIGGSDEARYLGIHVFKHTRLSDIKELWPHVMRLQKDLAGNPKKSSTSSKSLDRDIELYKLKQSGLTYKQIGDKFDMTYSDVSNIIRNLKDKIRRV